MVLLNSMTFQEEWSPCLKHHCPQYDPPPTTTICVSTAVFQVMSHYSQYRQLRTTANQENRAVQICQRLHSIFRWAEPNASKAFDLLCKTIDGEINFSRPLAENKQQLVSWSLMSLFSTNMAIPETKNKQQQHRQTKHVTQPRTHTHTDTCTHIS